MLLNSRRTAVYAYPKPVDLRLGYNGLFHRVQTGLGRDPLSGELYLFLNARRTTCKVLVWDGTGLCIFMKRLEGSRFAALWPEDGLAVKLTTSELALFIEGSRLVGKTALSPQEFVPKVARGLDADPGL